MLSMLSLGRTRGSYNPLIRYTWATSVNSTTGVRELVDSGTTPKYNADMYFGRGLSFNGVDQSISVPLITLPAEFTVSWVCDITTVILPIGGNNDYVYHSSGNLLIKIDGTSGTITPTTPFSGVQTFSITRDINNLISLYVDGIQSGNTITLSRAWELNSLANYSAVFSSGILSNILTINETLTPTQIAYQYNNPERFLYREDNILKSQTLSQAEIDNVVAYLPMCETDGYVRDLVGYSEGAVNSEITTTDATVSGSLNTAIDNGVGDFTLHVESSSTVSYHPIVRIINSNVTAGELYLMKVRIDIQLGSAYAKTLQFGNINGDGDSFAINEVLNAGDSREFEFIANFQSDGTFRCFFDAFTAYDTVVYNLFDATVVMTAKKLSATYPITNYLSSMRDNAINLQHGLQTSSLKRDLLGVPYASSFSALDCDGVGYVDTGWRATKGTDFIIELVQEFISDGSYHVSGSTSNGDLGRINLGEGNTSGQAFLKVCNTNSILVGANTINHLMFEFNFTTNLATPYLNGVAGTATSIVSYVDMSSNFHIGRENGGTYYVNKPIRLFKVHTEPQVPLDLYNNAVSKGLLS